MYVMTRSGQMMIKVYNPIAIMMNGWRRKRILSRRKNVRICSGRKMIAFANCPTIRIPFQMTCTVDQRTFHTETRGGASAARGAVEWCLWRMLSPACWTLYKRLCVGVFSGVSVKGESS